MEIIAYTSPSCFYCEQLHLLLDRIDTSDEDAPSVTIEYRMVDNLEKKQEFLEDNPTATGYPHVIVDGKPIGGLVEVAKLLLEYGLVTSKKFEKKNCSDC